MVRESFIRSNVARSGGDRLAPQPASDTVEIPEFEATIAYFRITRLGS